jgi:hypothetical protein
MKQRDAGVVFYGKAAIGHSQESARCYPAHFFNEQLLLLLGPDMFEHGIAINDIKGVLFERQRLAGRDSNMLYSRVRLQNGVPVGETGTSQILPVRIELFQHVRVCSSYITGPDIQDTILVARAHGLHKEIVNAAPGTSGDPPDKPQMPGVLIIPLVKLGGLIR